MAETISKSSGSSNTQLSTYSQSSGTGQNDSAKSSRESDSYIKVGVRVRPICSKENHYAVSNTIKFRGDDFVVQCPRTPWTMHGQEHIFQYDHMFWSCDNTYPFATQEDVYTTMGKPMVEQLFKGYNASLFIHGQVGSGKTYTMIGLDDIDDPQTSGILPRLSRELFNNLLHYDGSSYKIEVTNYEIYKEKIYDLLGPEESKIPLRVREHPNNGPYIEKLTAKEVANYEELRECIKMGHQNRMCCPNPLNEKSSKSHSIFCVKLTLQMENGSCRIGRVSLVDLAGSERLQHGLPEAHLVSINRSLFTLGKVISALSQRKKGNSFVSYRDSVLTWLLRQSLGGNSLTSMIATITPSSSKVMETLATLRYVKQARLVINPAIANDMEESTGLAEKPSRVESTNAGAGDVSNETSSDNVSYDSIQSNSGPFDELVSEDVIKNYIQANSISVEPEVKIEVLEKPEEVMACFTSVYGLLTKLQPKMCEEEFLIDAYEDCQHAIQKFERKLWQYLSKKLVK